MEETGFTSGPWEVIDDDHHELGTDSSVLIESTSRGITLAIIGPGDSTTYTEDMINARLIAAAPELLEELIETHSALCFTPDYLGSLRYERNKAAIAKALGKE